jgi:hypothetical protein
LFESDEDKTLLGANIDVFCRRLRINYIFNGNEEDLNFFHQRFFRLGIACCLNPLGVFLIRILYVVLWCPTRLVAHALL